MKRILTVGSVFVFMGLVIHSSAAGQEMVHLRLVHQGHFLPEGTRVVVLVKNVEPGEADKLQPVFFPLMRYPRDPAPLILRDSLDDTGRTRNLFPPTRRSGRLYFVYALVPGGEIYWSYSAKRRELKYDVVEKGVMSVAPVESGVTLADLRQRFFEPLPDSANKVAAQPDSAGRYTATVVRSTEAVPKEPVTPTAPISTGIRLPFWAFMLWLLVPLITSVILAVALVMKRRQIEDLRLNLTARHENRTETASAFKPEERPETARDLASEPDADDAPPVGNPLDPKTWNP